MGVGQLPTAMRHVASSREEFQMSLLSQGIQLSAWQHQRCSPSPEVLVWLCRQDWAPNASILHSKFVILVRLHSTLRGFKHDLFTSLRALVTEGTESGYHVYFLYQVGSSTSFSQLTSTCRARDCHQHGVKCNVEQRPAMKVRSLKSILRLRYTGAPVADH